jgi:aspartyl-tRNA(Asn)/glutamyl-tRNA(Gln) amidotransferase subunit A
MDWIEKKWLALKNNDALKKYSHSVNKLNQKIGVFFQFDPDLQKKGAIPFAVKDNISVSGFNLTCGSKMLENLKSPYNATAVQNLINCGGWVVGKTAMDEFGMGSSTTTSPLIKTHNPWDTRKVTGGSSGGSAAAVASGMVPLALGSDTGGSIRQPASFCGIYGLKPTYGTVSRYGLVAYASSLEVIGLLASNASIIEGAFSLIKGIDTLDQTSQEYPAVTSQEPKNIGILSNIASLKMHPDIVTSYKTTIQRLETCKYNLKHIDFPLFDYIAPAYYTIATAEASANLARFNGVRYGLSPDFAENPEELVKLARSQGFGDEVKLRILLGTYVLRSGFQDKYYLKAQKVRTAIRNKLDEIFSEIDLLLLPVFPVPPFDRDDPDLNPFQQKIADTYTCLANLAGIPALAIPSEVIHGLPIGVQLIGPAYSEDSIFSVAKKLEDSYPRPEPPLKIDDWS